MRKRYTAEERREALKLAEEIGGAGATRRLGIHEDALYCWRSREKQQQADREATMGGRSETDLLKENKRLRAQLKQLQEDVEILQDALVFFAKRRKP